MKKLTGKPVRIYDNKCNYHGKCGEAAEVEYKRTQKEKDAMHLAYQDIW